MASNFLETVLYLIHTTDLFLGWNTLYPGKIFSSNLNIEYGSTKEFMKSWKVS